MSFLYFLEGIRNPVLDFLFSIITLFGEETIEFVPEFFAQSGFYSSIGSKNICVTDGNIYIQNDWYEVSYFENADIKYFDEYLDWGIEENEENLKVLDKLKNTTNYYLLVAQTDDVMYKEVALVEIDNVYYFLELTDSRRVRRIHYISFSQGE